MENKNNTLNTPIELEQKLFPELKQNQKNIPIIKTFLRSEVDNIDDHFCIRKEKYKNDALVYESIWVHNNDLDKIDDAILGIQKIREGKKEKKYSIKNDYKIQKEKKFNRIYDKHFFPKNKRKEAYKHFVLNPNMYPKNIKKTAIEAFVTETSLHETKSFIKDMKKELKQFVKDDDKWVLDNYALKKKVKIYIPELDHHFTRAVDIFYLQKNEIKKIKQTHKDVPVMDIISEFERKRFDQGLQKEDERIKKHFNYINAIIPFKKLNKDNYILSFKKAIIKYNPDEMFELFLLTYFSSELRNSTVFSKQQRQLFNLRKKFRNKNTVNINNVSFKVATFLSYEEHIKTEYLNYLQNENGDFDIFLHHINSAIRNNKVGIIQEIILSNIKKALKEIISYSERNYDFKRLSTLSEDDIEDIFMEDFLKIFAELNNANHDALKREIDADYIQGIKNEKFDDLKGIIKNYLIKELIKIDYKASFPLARQHKRKIKFYMGETNSGKTYNAFNELVKAKSGIYLSPLRLLALEGQEEIEKRGKPCSMMTGEESDIKEGATFKSCTIEMLNPKEFVESIVIDEIQMIKDPNRGWAWVQALVGSPAENIILAGSPEVLSIVKRIVEYTGDELEIFEYKRKSPLIIMDKPIKLNEIKPSTAIVAFSRRKVLELKDKLADRNVSVIYGNLGPEVRKEEARKFREGETEILIATDAIAMGLNLPIETIIFSTHEKNIRGDKIEIDEQLVKQIAGRAGRYGIKNKGYVGSLSGGTLKYIKEMLNKKIDDYDGLVPIMPNIDYLEKIKYIIKSNSLSKTLTAFHKYADFNSELFYCTDLTKRIELAKVIDKYGFELLEGFMLSSAPVRETYDGGIDYFELYIKILFDAFYGGNFKMIYSPNTSKFEKLEKAKNNEILRDAEEIMHNIELYSWFSNRYEDMFFDIDEVSRKRKLLNDFIINSLKK